MDLFINLPSASFRPRQNREGLNLRNLVQELCGEDNFARRLRYDGQGFQRDDGWIAKQHGFHVFNQIAPLRIVDLGEQADAVSNIVSSIARAKPPNSLDPFLDR